MKIVRLFLLSVLVIQMTGCKTSPKINSIALLADGWRGEIIAGVDQSYAGWDVEIGDADNDGQNEILTTGCPNSRLYISKKINTTWETKMLADNLAQAFPGMGLAVKVVDLNFDKKNEIILGTGQETGETALFYLFDYIDGKLITKHAVRSEYNSSSYTHNLASCDLDKDGIMEVVSAYCGGGEVIRYDFDNDLNQITSRKIYHLSGSGEESLISDVDNDGQVEYITSNGFRHGKATVEIYEFDDKGELVTPPRIVIDGFDGNKCFYSSAMVGDVDNDQQNELVVGWKVKQDINKATILVYDIKEQANQVYTLAYEDPDFDLAYFEKMMVVNDVDNDGKNEIVISTRGDEHSEKVAGSRHLGHVFMFKVENSEIKKELLVNFNETAESSWIDVGDADNDGKNELIVVTGKGDRTRPGTSYIVLVEKE